ncbi:hypothetical protein [Streptomyces sp. SP18CS02]|uniref:hypothetical protein n=1 Tax=Streptomyces sp. SP18CS02 TaxID=3002531 RepID=UPI002E75B490|nr:hypothetical protein [Streptomyces sp. SP18CS02]MEE1751743.1 hypothetical protein [Streptomyces sp. SP18CS02]
MPALPEDLLDLIRELQRKVQRLSTAAVTRPALDTISGGGLTITDGGRLTVRDAQDNTLLYLGSIQDHDDGTPQQGALIRREDGSLALGLYGDETQALSIWDRFGSIVAADDTQRGGLARPYVPIPLYPAPAPLVSDQWTRVLQGGMYLQHPQLAVGVWVQAGADTTVEARVRYLAEDGATAQLGETVTATGEAFTRMILAPHERPIFSWSSLYVEGRRTSGTGDAAVGVLFAEGRQS